MKNNKKKLLNIIIFGLIIVIICTSIYLLYKRQEEINTKEYINNTKIQQIDKKKTNKDIINTYQNKFNNQDIKGILEIDNLFITQIVQTTDNKYYLSHNLNKENSFLGAVFIDYRNDLNGRQINFYGHNSGKYNIPFRNLTKYLNKDFYDKNKIIKFATQNETKYYEIFSVAIVSKSSKEEHMQFEYNTNNDWLEHFKRLKDKSIYDTNLVLSNNDNIIVLQTCLFNKYNGKLIIISAKQINI